MFFKKELAYLYSLILIFIGTEVSVYLIKVFINRGRPIADIAYYIEKSGSFPSGHSAIAIAFFGFMTYYLIHHISGRNMRPAIIFIGTLLIVSIGFSRLYLGVHFLSDVLGGFIIGGLWLIVGITFRERHFYNASLKKGKNPDM
jgi:undecaprenyl-diphosphatase